MTGQPEGELRMIDGWPYRVVDRRLIRSGKDVGQWEVTLRDDGTATVHMTEVRT
jgi:hypothetical protein